MPRPPCIVAGVADRLPQVSQTGEKLGSPRLFNAINSNNRLGFEPASGKEEWGDWVADWGNIMMRT